MDAADLNSLIGELFGVIHAIAGYPVPQNLPDVRLAPLAQLQAMVCRGPCQVRAFYLPEHGIVVNEALDVKRDMVARSVLLHELVHHVQHLSGKFDNVSTACGRWFFREREAYEIQNVYLRDNREATRFFFDSVPFMCGDPAAETAKP